LAGARGRGEEMRKGKKNNNNNIKTVPKRVQRYINLMRMENDESRTW